MTHPDERFIEDPLQVEDLLDEEDRAIGEVVRRFVTSEVIPHVHEWYEAGAFPRELVKELAAMGLLGMHLEGYGCAGAGPIAYGVACRELEAGDSGLRSFVSVQGSLSMTAIHAFGSEEQKQQWLPAMAAGEAIGCFGLTEPDVGSNPAGMRTSARRDGDDWILDGTKLWITNGTIADVAVVWARTDEGIQGFLVETDTPGFSARDIPRKLSLRASYTSELSLADCRVPDAARLPGVASLRGPLTCLNEARYGIVWGVTGAARSCYRSAVDYAGSREQFDQPIAGFQLTQRKLVDMSVELVKAQLLAVRIGQLKAADRLDPEQLSYGKLNNCRIALDIARTARTIHGANGITLDYPVFRHMNNLESVATYEGTEEMHTLSIGRRLTGLAAFS